MSIRLTSFSDDCIDKLYFWTSGYLSVSQFDELLDKFNDEIAKHYFTKTSENNFIRLFTAVYDRTYLLKDCLFYPHYPGIIISLVSNSNYLTDIAVRNPEYLNWVLATDALNSGFDEHSFESDLRQMLSSYQNLNSKVNLLKSIKRKETLRIGLRDILGIQTLRETTTELSIIAKTLTAILFELCYESIQQKYKIKTIKNKYVLFALGKLGGGELNYSSDIDLMLAFEKNTLISKKIEYFEFLSEVIFLFIDFASSVTDTGFLYRVDFRLRPDGKNSLLCRTLGDTLQYYEIRGEDWERQMLIKTGFISGDKELFEYFINYVQPFVYPHSFSVSPIAQINKLRKITLDHLKDDRSIKLSFGGIRDIEFSLQALQLLNGGKNPDLRTGSSLKAIDALHEAKIISSNEKESLSKSYILYRKIEHFLQLMNDLQTHSIPIEGELLEKLSVHLGFISTNSFVKKVEATKKEVQKFYASILEEDVNSVSSDIEETVINYEDKQRAQRNILFLREGKGILEQRSFDNRTMNLFAEIELPLTEYLVKAGNPDGTLNNLVRIIKASKFPSLWYEACRNKSFLTALLKVAEFSQFSVDLFAEDAQLRELFLSGKSFQVINPVSTELSLKELRFCLAVQFTLGIIEQKDAAQTLSTVLKHRFNILFDEYFSSKKYKSKITAAAMGSFASGEMTFFSDIDLVFISKGCERYSSIQKDVFDFINNLREQLHPFTVDSRLRPEGKTSLIIWDINKYIDYLDKRAQTWELMSLSKLSFLSGSREIFSQLAEAVENRISLAECKSIKKDIYDMRIKLYPKSIGQINNRFHIKKSRGGIVDIEFIIQFLILCSPDLFLNAFGGNVMSLLDLLNNENKLLNDDADSLRDNYLFLKRTELVVQSLFNSGTSLLPVEDKKLELAAYLLGFNSREDFQIKLNKVIKMNSNIYSKIIAGDL